ncbi:hypothetical protein P171DRAFT_438499 [Karstenula rhodostoma CBS 690.94]|uniref:Protein kinase domain-containing protein n=1 Tax=Karstenula rhodostoma CBS 690.94 TaxID=1392251 RepID=A0A9P4PX17_9PLEO|nr:hypothetical protein P171DRAFT_438499 [Karstenula rhodostoma CBS 690.94]
MLPYKSPFDVAIATNNKYVGITLAGTGITADVWLFSTRAYLKSELPAMKLLQTVPEELRARFTKPLDFSEVENVDNPCWYAMEAIHGFTLSQLRGAAKFSKMIIPQEFVFHVYLQLHEALEFLHTSVPPMIKGDLVAVNVMIDPTTQDVPGFPNVKLIDFGGAQVLAVQNDVRLGNDEPYV